MSTISLRLSPKQQILYQRTVLSLLMKSEREIRNACIIWAERALFDARFIRESFRQRQVKCCGIRRNFCTLYRERKEKIAPTTLPFLGQHGCGNITFKLNGGLQSFNPVAGFPYLLQNDGDGGAFGRRDYFISVHR